MSLATVNHFLLRPALVIAVGLSATLGEASAHAQAEAAFAPSLTIAPAPAASAATASQPPEVSLEPAPAPRPPPLSDVPTHPLPRVAWQSHVEVGAALAYVSRPAAPRGADQGIHYAPAFGFSLSGRLPLQSWLGAIAYFVQEDHAVDLPEGSLGPGGTSDHGDLHTYAFGLRLAPTWTLGQRWRLWGSAGLGWGRMEFGAMTLGAGPQVLRVRERANPFLEFPMGVGADMVVVPRWLLVRAELLGAPIRNQRSTAVSPMQIVDATGALQHVGPLPGFGWSWTPSVGFVFTL